MGFDLGLQLIYFSLSITKSKKFFSVSSSIIITNHIQIKEKLKEIIWFKYFLK